MIIDVVIFRAICDQLPRLRVVSDLFIKEVVDKTANYISQLVRAL